MTEEANTLYAQSDVLDSGSAAPAAPPSVIDYTAWDYKAIKARLVEIAKAQFPDVYNNFTEQDFGMMAIEYMAGITDMMSFKLDYLINEAFLPTALLPKNVRRHARRVGYHPRPRCCAIYDFALNVEEPYSVDIPIEAGRRLMTAGKDGQTLICELFLADDEGRPIMDAPIIIPAGTVGVTNVVGIEGESRATETVGTNESFQTIAVGDSNIIEDSIELLVDDVIWQKVDVINEAGPVPVYRVDQDDRTGQFYVIVGDGMHGATIPRGSRAVLRYRVGGGERGNVPAGFFNLTTTVVVSGAKLAAPIIAINRTRGRGGDDGETIDDIRVNMPAWYKTQDRLVTLDDYSLFASRFSDSYAGRVAKGRAYLRHAGCSANIVDVYVLEYLTRDECAVPTDKLLRALSQAMDDKKMCTHEVCVRSGQAVFVDVQVHGYLTRGTPSAQRQETERRVRQAVERFFDLSAWNFGRAFSSSAIQRYLGNIREVDDFSIQTVLDPGYTVVDGAYATRHWEIIRPRTIEVTVEVLR